MLPRRLRLPRAGFSPSKGAFRVASEHFSVSYTRSLHGGGAAIVGKDVAKRSVVRHLLRRRILVIIRPWVTKTHSLVVRAKKGSPTLSFVDMQKELQDLLGRIFAQ